MSEQRAVLRERLHAALDALLDLFDEYRRERAAPGAEIIPLTRQAMEAEALDYAPMLVAAKTGKLRTVFQGRRRLTTRAWLAAYVLTLPPAVAPCPVDDVASAAARRAQRRRAR
jgi:hypothetical protein